MVQEYGKQTQYRRASLVVLAALEDLNQASQSKSMVLPWYMRDKSVGYFDQAHKARQVSAHITQSFWYRWISMGVIAISIIAVVWTPNSSQTGPDSKVAPSAAPPHPPRSANVAPVMLEASLPRLDRALSRLASLASCVSASRLPIMSVALLLIEVLLCTLPLAISTD